MASDLKIAARGTVLVDGPRLGAGVRVATDAGTAFCDTGSEPGPLESAEWLNALPPLQRLLLSTDGTMTTALAAYHGEPIDIQLLSQHVVALSERDATLQLPAGGRVLWRRVLLYGRHSAARLLYGRSRVALDRLSQEVQAELLEGDAPIGLVLRQRRLETFRSLLDLDLRPASAEVARHLGVGLVCSKTYAIIAGGRPLMVVHEEFSPRSLSDAA